MSEPDLSFLDPSRRMPAQAAGAPGQPAVRPGPPALPPGTSADGLVAALRA